MGRTILLALLLHFESFGFGADFDDDNENLILAGYGPNQCFVRCEENGALLFRTTETDPWRRFGIDWSENEIMHWLMG